MSVTPGRSRHEAPGSGASSPSLEYTPSDVELGRRAYRKRQTSRSILISLGSTVVVVAAIVVALMLSPNWALFQQTFLNPQYFVESFPSVIEGLWLNIRVLFWSVIAVAIFSTLLAVIRTLRGPVFFPLRALAAAYTDLFRGLPLLIVLYLVGFGIPALQIFPKMPAEFWGIVALTLTYSAYVAEVLRAGIEAVHPSQYLASRSLGLSHYQSLRMVVMPQAIRKVTPALMNDFVSMQKDVGLISVLGAVDAVRAAYLDVAQTFNYTPYVLAGLLFVALSWPMIRLTDWYTAKLRKREQMGGAA